MNFVRNISTITSSPSSSARFSIQMQNSRYSVAQMPKLIHCRLEIFFILVFTCVRVDRIGVRPVVN